jgi:protein phosphatase
LTAKLAAGAGIEQDRISAGGRLQGEGEQYRAASRGLGPATLRAVGTPPSKLELRSYGATDIGRRRKVNQDAFLCDDELGLWVVADGMGGHAAGEVASRESVDAIHGMVRSGKRAIDLEGTFTDDKARAASRLLEGAVQSATYIVYAMAEIDADMAGMGTTISAMMSFCEHLVVAQVGDSRIYRVRDGGAVQLTEDHTLIAWQLKQGLISPDEASHAKHKNVITRAVGNRDYVQVDTSVFEVECGDSYLLCSDGLHGYLEPAEIPELTLPGGNEAVRRFISLANERGGKDNITALLVEVL